MKYGAGCTTGPFFIATRAFHDRHRAVERPGQHPGPRRPALPVPAHPLAFRTAPGRLRSADPRSVQQPAALAPGVVRRGPPMRTAERTGTTLPTTRLQPLPRHPGRRHAVPQRLPGVPPRSRPSARPHPAIAATAGDLAEPGGDRTDRTDPHRRLRPARHRAAPLSRHGLLHRPRRPRRWLLQPAPVVGTASGLREDRPPLRRRHPPGHRETRVRRLHPEDGAGLSRPGHRRRHRTARGTRGA
ncbi:hypothetical protein LT20_01583 [Pseudomonas aeruginosa]|nr:hypothetical protein LT20_01583 [Pseudomonas aeruginosa]